nr:MAG TPA: hypothetical protein [Caudoviricetes sp.]
MGISHIYVKENSYKDIKKPASFLSQLCFLGKFKKHKYKLIYI